MTARLQGVRKQKHRTTAFGSGISYSGSATHPTVLIRVDSQIVNGPFGALRLEFASIKLSLNTTLLYIRLTIALKGAKIEQQSLLAGRLTFPLRHDGST